MTIKNALLLGLGGISIAFGFIGIFLPILPTTPFVLVAAGCFSASSPSMYKKLAKSRYFGQFVENYKEKTGIERKVKVTALVFLWATLCISSLVFPTTLVRIILLAVGIGVTVHICMIKEKSR